MENFIFSVNVTIPIFLIILLGYILRRFNFLTDEFVTVANRYVFVVALPVMLFTDISETDVREDMNLKFFLYCLIVTVVMFFMVWGIAKLTIKDKSMIGAFAQAGARGSAAVLGVAFVENICGSIGMTPLMIVAAVPFFNILSVIILVFNANNKEEKNYGKIKDACINIIKNPIIIGICLGLIASLVKLNLPVIGDRTLDYIARTATPIALIAIGAGFDTKEAIKKLKPALGASFIKLIGLPMIFLPIAYAIGFAESEMVAILIMLASPTTVSCYIMAKNMDNDEVLTSNVVVLTTLFSSVTLTLWIFVLRSLGCI
ncbi:MAG: AEC family transporter [Lachnospiraceae bacterium]|nr:AEC family transporter [Lachnospiraceae bacterium]